MFIGRIEETKALLKTFATPNCHSLVYGNRRVGKTELVNKAAIDSGLPFLSYECVKSSLSNNLDRIAKQLYEQGITPSSLSFPSFMDLFRFLNSLNKHLIVLIDEYPYLYYKNDKNEVDSEFQGILDKYSQNLNLVLSGSHIGMMKNMLQEKNPLFGRMKTIIHLKELNYLESSEFYPDLSNYDKASFYGVFGGSPFILQQLDQRKSLEENIEETFLKSTSSIAIHVAEGYTTDLSTKDSANQIFEALGNSKVRHKKIEESLEYEHNGLLSKQLNILLEMEFIDKNVPINRIGDKKKTSYYIKNNALRFYFTYVYGRQNILSILGPKAFYERFIKESLSTYLSYRFEEIVRDYISLEVKRGNLQGIYNVGTYYYDDIINRKNGEFDVAIQKKDGFDIIEVKFLKGKVDKKTIRQEISEIKEIREIDVLDIGFASINGFEDDVEKLSYMINGDDIYR